MNKKELLLAIYGITVIITILILCLIGSIYFPPKIEYISMDLYIYKDLGYFPFVLIISGFLIAPIIGSIYLGMNKDREEFDNYIEQQKTYEKEHGKHSLHNKPRNE